MTPSTIRSRLPSAARPWLIGMVHLQPLPGTPAAPSLQRTIDRALADAATWRRAGADALLVENFGDQPFHPATVPAVTIAAMAAVLAALRVRDRGMLGVNVLRNDADGALALATAFDLAFVRINVHAGAAVTDQGLLVGQAHATVRRRAELGCRAALFADVRVKHAAPLAERPVVDEGRELAGRARADALLVTGRATGEKPDLAALGNLARALPRVPILLASGVTPAIITATRGRAAGWIVGTWAKRGGRVEAPVDLERARRLVRAAESGVSRLARAVSGR